jgi:hypothetical protein
MCERRDVRRLALSLPDATESVHFGAASFKTRKALFAVLREPELATLRLHPEDQANMVALHPDLVRPVSGGSRNDRAGREGWSYVRYGGFDEQGMAALLKLAWAAAAPHGLL